MKVSIRVAENFKKEAKPLLKKYRSLKDELTALEQELVQNPALGTPLGAQIFKIRLAIKSKGRGKSGGARVITYLEIEFLTQGKKLLLSISFQFMTRETWIRFQILIFKI